MAASFAPRQGQSAVQVTGLAELSATLLAVYLGMHGALMGEIMTGYIHLRIPIVAITGIIVTMIYLANGYPIRFLSSSISIPYLFLMFWWMALTVLMSFRGHWVDMFLYSIRFHLVVFVICGIALNMRLVRKMIVGFGIGYAVSLAGCFAFGRPDAAGRFHIPETSLSNPNDLAFHLLFGMAMLTLFWFDKSYTHKFFSIICIVAVVYFALKTGSRANLLTMGALALTMITFSRAKILLVACVGILALVMAAALPKTTLVRLFTFETATVDAIMSDRSLVGAVTSTEARKQLQKRAVLVAMQHPIAGVGPHMFIYALDDYMRNTEGLRKGSWQAAHNTFLEIGAESGVIGLAIYTFVVLWCIRTNFRCIRATQVLPELRPAYSQSVCLLLSSVIYAFGTLFCSIPYTPTLPFLVGLTAANSLALQEEVKQQPVQAGV